MAAYLVKPVTVSGLSEAMHDVIGFYFDLVVLPDLAAGQQHDQT